MVYYDYLHILTFFLVGSSLQIIEVCLISLITSIVSFGLPILRKCSPCPESELNSGIECPRPPGMYGNYVNVISILSCSCLIFILFMVVLAFE